MVSSAEEDDSQFLRQRPTEKEIEVVEIVKKEEEEGEEEELISKEKDEKEKLSDSDREEETEQEPEIVQHEPSVNSADSVRVYRGVRNLQPIQRPSLLSRQFTNVKNFFLELIDFLLLFLTTLFNPMADVNNQVQEHNQRRQARDGKFYSSCKPTSFPGCGPSS